MSETGGRIFTVLGMCSTALLALSTAAYAVIGAVQVVVVQDGQAVPQATLNILQAEEVVAEDETDNLGVGFIPLEEGRYTLAVGSSGETVTGSIEVKPGEIASFTVDLDAGTITANERPLDQYRPLNDAETARGYDVAAADLDGLLSIRITLDPGLIFLGIPAQAVENQTMSWGAVLLPFGETEEAQTERMNQLTQHTVGIGDKRHSLTGITKWTMVAQQVIHIKLFFSAQRDPVVELTLNLNTLVAEAQVTVTGSGRIVARAGWPVRIPGSFDGLAENTVATFAGEPVDVIAETSTGIYFNPPAGPYGMQPVSVAEANGASRTSMIRNVGLELWADDLDLWKGESTMLHLRLFGLQDLTGPAYVSLLNASVANVSLSPSNFQFFLIQPGAVAAGGTVEYDRRLRGIQRGYFEINAVMILQ